ncbi:MAG: hypothetical protein CL608_20000 [Anaerolineaceae bacterium]|nr:hypothetical protein [Anaerolineaceae bacterium]
MQKPNVDYEMEMLSYETASENLDHAERFVRRIAARISLNFDTLINTHLVDKARWEHLEHHQDTLWREVQQDGISLYDLATQPAT